MGWGVAERTAQRPSPTFSRRSATRRHREETAPGTQAARGPGQDFPGAGVVQRVQEEQLHFPPSVPSREETGFEHPGVVQHHHVTCGQQGGKIREDPV